MTLHGACIDLNVDVGERPLALLDGSERRLLQFVSSANIACGGHAGDVESMKRVVELCLSLGVSIGAHPSYPDRLGFGREKIDISPSALATSISRQIESLVVIAQNSATSVRHVKPHGALYNAAVNNAELSMTIANAVAAIDKKLILVGLAGSKMLEVWRDAGFTVAGEAFADRRYESDGTLRPRSSDNALVTNPDEATERVLTLVRDGKISAVDGTLFSVDAQTVCLHSDTENAITLAESIRAGLRSAGVAVQPF
jgi:5-oxoprolinase (ATP-hydrolysing) subunit A